MGMRYTTDLTDAHWQLIAYCFPKPAKTGRPREHSYRELLNGIFYVVRTGCQWRNLPKDFAPWGTVYDYFRQWRKNGLWERIHTHLREQVRACAGRKRHASAGIIDSQSVRSSECSQTRGYDAGKKVKGCKRHLLVDTLGLVLQIMVLPANIQDRDGARRLLAAFYTRTRLPRVRRIWADAAYAGAFLAWAKQLWRCTVEIVRRVQPKGFQVLRRRWVVERTFGWLGRYRRLTRDYERQAHTGETLVYVAMIRLMLNRLA